MENSLKRKLVLLQHCQEPIHLWWSLLLQPLAAAWAISTACRLKSYLLMSGSTKTDDGKHQLAPPRPTLLQLEQRSVSFVPHRLHSCLIQFVQNPPLSTSRACWGESSRDYSTTSFLIHFLHAFSGTRSISKGLYWPWSRRASCKKWPGWWKPT